MLSKEHSDSIKKAFALGGIKKLKEYLNAEKDKWKQIPLYVAVTGNSGVGKSCFINAFRNVKRGEDLFAEEDVVETTAEPTPYKHPEHDNFVLWDLPGVGTSTYPRERYMKKVEFQKYDFFLILSSQRFTENDHWLANEITRAGKRFFFLRTQIDVDVLKRSDLKEVEVVQKVRYDCMSRLQVQGFDNAKELLFLINNKDPLQYDFDKLTTAILEKLPMEKREALALSLTTLTDGVIKAKKSALQKRIFLVAIASAAGAAVPIPGVGLAVDVAILLGEAHEYRKQFGLDDKTLEENARALESTVDRLKKDLDLRSLIISASVKSITGLCTSVAVSTATENAIKFAVPIIGSVIAAGISYGVSVACLTSLLQSFSVDAIKVNKAMLHMLSTSSSVARALE